MLFGATQWQLQNILCDHCTPSESILLLIAALGYPKERALYSAVQLLSSKHSLRGYVRHTLTALACAVYPYKINNMARQYLIPLSSLRIQPSNGLVNNGEFCNVSEILSGRSYRYDRIIP